MMLYFVCIFILLFIFIGIIPYIRSLVLNLHMTEEKVYEFPQELLDSNMDHLRYEHVEGAGISRISIQNRGSVRLARGNILSVENLEQRKVEAYSVELP